MVKKKEMTRNCIAKEYLVKARCSWTRNEVSLKCTIVLLHCRVGVYVVIGWFVNCERDHRAWSLWLQHNSMDLNNGHGIIFLSKLIIIAVVVSVVPKRHIFDILIASLWFVTMSRKVVAPRLLLFPTIALLHRHRKWPYRYPWLTIVCVSHLHRNLKGWRRRSLDSLNATRKAIKIDIEASGDDRSLIVVPDESWDLQQLYFMCIL